MEFPTNIKGIPCICRVTTYHPGTNYPIHSASIEPNDPEEFEYIILDRRGRYAAWLERKIDDEIDQRIYEEFKEHKENI